jgi:hypothetical protein
VVVRKGLVVCVLTGDVGRVAGPGLRLVRAEVTDLTNDGTADLRVTSWVAWG